MDFLHREHRNALPCLCPQFPSLEGTQVQRRPPTLARKRLTNTCIRVDLTIARQHAMFRLTDIHWPHPSILKTPHALATPFDPYNSTLTSHTLDPHSLATPIDPHNSTLTGHTHPPPLTTPHPLATPRDVTHWPHPSTHTHWPHLDPHWPHPSIPYMSFNITHVHVVETSCLYIYQLQTSYLIHYISSHSQTTPINPHSLATPIGPHNSTRLATTHWLTTNSLTITYNITIFNNSVCKCGCRLPTSTLILHSLCAMESSTLSTTTISLPVELWAASPGNQLPCATCRPCSTVYPPGYTNLTAEGLSHIGWALYWATQLDDLQNSNSRCTPQLISKCSHHVCLDHSKMYKLLVIILDICPKANPMEIILPTKLAIN